MKTKNSLIIPGLLLISLIITACGGNPDKGQNLNLANPASVYCEEQGYQFEIREDESGQYGVCVFLDNTECEEWAYFRGECGPDKQGQPTLNMANPASVYCEDNGGTLEIQEDENGQYGVCTFPDNSECEEWAYFRGDCAPGGTTENQTGNFEPFMMPVVAIYGSVISSGIDLPAPSKLVITPEGMETIFVTGETGDVENQILSLRDKPMPSNKANFWGQLDCPSENKCLLTVSQMQLDGPGSETPADLVEAWQGVIYNGPAGPHSAGDDYFTLLGAMPFQYGIDGADDDIRQQIESLRDTRQAVMIWGQIYAGRMDWNGAQIIVSKIEPIEADPSQIPAAPEW